MPTTSTWTSSVASSGNTYDWFSSSNWTSGVPDYGLASDNAYFAQTAGTNPYAVTLISQSEVDVQNATLDDSNLTLAVNGNFNVGSTLTVTAGTLSLTTGEALLVGGLNLGPGFVVADGSIVIGSAGTIVGDGYASVNDGDGGGLYVETADNTGAGTLEFDAGGTVIAAYTGVANTSTLEVAANVVGTGNFQIQAGAALALDFNVDPRSTVTFDGSTGTLAENYNNAPTDDGGLTYNDNGKGLPDSDLQVSVAGMQVGTGGAVLDAIEIIGDTTATAVLTSGTLTVSNAGGGGTDVFTLTGGTYNPTIDQVGTQVSGGNTFFHLDSVCFAAGTRILTADDERPVETISAGDYVVVLRGDVRSLEPVKWVGYRTIDLSRHPRPRAAAPIRIARDAIDDHVPGQDLLVSPEHCLLFDGVLLPARQLVNDMTITQDLNRHSVSYYHLELERHAIVLAEDVPAETYLDTGNRAFFSNAGLALILHPEFLVNVGLRCWETDACAPLAGSAEQVQPIWQRLADRAVALGHARRPAATTMDADIHLLADGRRIDAINVHGGVYSFMVGRGIQKLSLVSRSVISQLHTPYVDDPRRLGIAARRITVHATTGHTTTEHGAMGRIDFPADHPALCLGWHAPERGSGMLWRWTNGHADLPLCCGSGPTLVEIAIAHTTAYPIEGDQFRRHQAA